MKPRIRDAARRRPARALERPAVAERALLGQLGPHRLCGPRDVERLAEDRRRGLGQRGLQDGLGSRITSAAAFTAYPRAWAYVVGACVLGLIFYLATLVAERFAMPWRSRLAS